MNKFRKRQLTIPKCIRKSRNPDVGVVNCRIIIICLGIWAYNDRLKHRSIHYNNPFFMPHRENLWKLKPQGIFFMVCLPTWLALGCCFSYVPESWNWCIFPLLPYPSRAHLYDPGKGVLFRLIALSSSPTFTSNIWWAPYWSIGIIDNRLPLYCIFCYLSTCTTKGERGKMYSAITRPRSGSKSHSFILDNLRALPLAHGLKIKIRKGRGSSRIAAPSSQLCLWYFNWSKRQVWPVQGQ